MSRTARRLRDAAAVLLAGSLVACASLGGAGDEVDAEPVVRDLTLHVNNQNYYDATIYAVAPSGARQRLGVARGLGQATFRFRWPHLELRVIIDLLAARASISESLPVSEGDELELTIQPDAHRP